MKLDQYSIISRTNVQLSDGEKYYLPRETKVIKVKKTPTRCIYILQIDDEHRRDISFELTGITINKTMFNPRSYLDKIRLLDKRIGIISNNGPHKPKVLYCNCPIQDSTFAFDVIDYELNKIGIITKRAI